MIKLLFTGGGGVGNESIYQQWNSIYDLHFCDVSLSAFNYVLPREKCHVIPYATAPNYLEELSRLCTQLNIDILIPGVDEELVHMQKISENIRNIVVLCPDNEFIVRMSNKYSFNQILLENNLTAPKTALVATSDALDLLKYPAIVKPIYGRGSRGVWTIHGMEQLVAYKELLGFKNSELIIQERLEGDEYTVFISADCAGKIGAVIPVKVSNKRGITIEAETNSHDAVIDYCLKFHKLFNPMGCYNIQLIKTLDGRVYPFELNPRISTTFCLAIATGYDPIKTVL